METTARSLVGAMATAVGAAGGAAMRGGGGAPVGAVLKGPGTGDGGATWWGGVPWRAGAGGEEARRGGGGGCVTGGNEGELPRVRTMRRSMAAAVVKRRALFDPLVTIARPTVSPGTTMVEKFAGVAAIEGIGSTATVAMSRMTARAKVPS